MKSTLFLISWTLFCFIKGNGQTGFPGEPVRYTGGQTIDPGLHEGRLRYAIGTENLQTMRANRTHPEMADGYGWTYNHGSNICYWNGQFFQHYLSNPVDEHIAPGQTLVLTSGDGRHWNKPVVVFPPYQAPQGVRIPEGYNGYMMHQRMGFYVSPSGRLLVIGFYGHTEDPFGKGGIGRVVREVYKDGGFGPIYFIRYSSHADWNESNTSYPFYKKSGDTGFVAACGALLKDRLMSFQWYDEDQGLDGFYNGKKAGEALSWYHRKDGKVVALWKKSLTALSSDEGYTFSDPVQSPTFLMSGGKQWGQRTKDGRYAICYNPIDLSDYRYPLVVVTGKDGILFDHMLLVQGEVPPRRFSGRWKDFGPCYMRGIEEGNGIPPGNDMWLSYSMNKEDIWISRIPLPIRYAVKDAVRDNFDQLLIDGPVRDWNIYSPAWAGVSVVKNPGIGVNSMGNGVKSSGISGTTDKSLRLLDKDPYDYARAIRVFQEGTRVKTSFRIYADPANMGLLEIDLTDRYGNRPVRLRFDNNGQIMAREGGTEKLIRTYQKGKWYRIKLVTETAPGENELNGNYSLWIDGEKFLTKAKLAEAVKSVERLSFRTGHYRNFPDRLTPTETKDPPLIGADEPSAPTIFYIDDVEVQAF
ncbi:six-hairpin glycosidase [Flavitalea flava]